MALTRAEILTAVGYYYKYALTIKQTETYEAIQNICDDLASDFDMFKGLEDSSAGISLTENIAFVDVSSELEFIRDRRVTSVVLVDSANHSNDKTLIEKDYLTHYLKLVPDPTNPDTSKLFDLPVIYAYYQDNFYFYPIPDISTLSITVYFDKVHPTITDDQDILYPTDFKQLIVQGVLSIVLDMADRKDGTVNDKLQKYEAMKQKKILTYKHKPNLHKTIKCNW